MSLGDPIGTQSGHQLSFEASPCEGAFWVRVDAPQSPVGTRAAERFMLTLAQARQLQAALESISDAS
jgi:hypothetical protein